MPKRRIFAGIALALLAFADVGTAHAEFHYYEGVTTLSTPRVGGYRRDNTNASRYAYAEYPATGYATHAMVPYAAMNGGVMSSYSPSPYTGTGFGAGLAPPPGSGVITDRIILSGPTSIKSPVESEYDMAMDWAADIGGGHSYQEASKNNLPRAPMITRMDRKAAGDRE